MLSPVRVLARPVRVLAQRRPLSSLVIAEHNGKQLSECTLAAVTACSKMGTPVTLLVAGSCCKEVVDSAATVSGVDSVAVFESDTLAHGVAEEWTPLVVAMQQTGGHSHVVAGASSFSKALLPRVSALLDVAQAPPPRTRVSPAPGDA